MVFNHYVTRKTISALAFGVLVGFSFTYISTPSPSSDNGHKAQQNEVYALTNRTVASQLFDEVKILCVVMTDSSSHETKAKHVLKTWGSRCNKLLFMSSDKDEEINAIPLPIKEGENNLWAKTKSSFKYIYENHLNEFDWFLKADDETYVIVENLRFMLYPHAAETPIYFGHKFDGFVKQGYMLGGAGYVLSREALRRLVEDSMPNRDKCRQEDDGAEDIEIGTCLQNVNVLAGDSRDAIGKNRFFFNTPQDHMMPFHTKLPTNSKDSYDKRIEGLDGCSNNAISFHFISSNQMYVLDYLIYRLRPYGSPKNAQSLPDKHVSAV